LLVGLGGLEVEGEALQAAQARGERGPPARHPDGIRHDDRVGRGGGADRPECLGEVGRAHLLLRLPQELDVDRDPGVDRGAGAEQRGECRPLVVGRAPPEVHVAELRELEGLRPPGLGLPRGRLDVEVVVDGHGRPSLPRLERPEHDRVPAGNPVKLGPAPEGPDRGGAELGTPLDVGLATGLGRDARDLDEVLQEALETLALLRGESFQVGSGERHGAPPFPRSSHGSATDPGGREPV
jgi:hypothetical protein